MNAQTEATPQKDRLFLLVRPINMTWLKELGEHIQRVEQGVKRSFEVKDPLNWFAEEREDEKGFEVTVAFGGRASQVKFTVLLPSNSGEPYARNGVRLSLNHLVEEIVRAIKEQQ